MIRFWPRILRHGPAVVAAAAFSAWLLRRYGPELAIVTGVAFLGTWAYIPRLARYLRRRRIVVPAGGRSSHRGFIPEMGGLAVYLPCALTALWLVALGGGKALGLLLGCTMLLGVGLLDDIRGAPPKLKILVQALGAGVLVLAGFRLDVLGVPGLGILELGPLSVPLTIFWVVLATNAFNLIDGMDGIAGGIAAVALAGLVYLRVDAGLASVVLGALLGFLPYNLPRARIFLGDSGTMFIGFLLAALLMDLPSGANLPLAIGLFAYPLADLALAVLRRFVRGKPIFRGDKSHIHHKLRVHLGSDRLTMIVVWTLALASAAVGMRMRNFKFLILSAGLWSAMAVFLVLMGRVRLRRMIGSRRPFQGLHLTRQYVEGRLRLAKAPEEIAAALERLIADLALEYVRVPGLTVGHPFSPEGAGERVVVPLRRGRAEWARGASDSEEEALVEERRSILKDLLTLADRRLRQVAGSATRPAGDEDLQECDVRV